MTFAAVVKSEPDYFYSKEEIVAPVRQSGSAKRKKPDAFQHQASLLNMVAGTGFEPMTFARGYEERARRPTFTRRPSSRAQTEKYLELFSTRHLS